MSKTKVSVNVCGNDYVILSNDDENYVKMVSKEVDENINVALKSNIRKSVSKAAILVALNYCDRTKKLQDEMNVYLETIQQDQIEIQKLKNEISELNTQLQNVKKKKFNNRY